MMVVTESSHTKGPSMQTTTTIGLDLANPAKADPWLLGLLARMPFRQAAIALANKTARIIWALLARGGAYVARHQPVVQVASA